MEHLWTGADGDVKSVHRAVGRRPRITLNTVQSTLKRLHEKGLLQREKVSHAYVYQASTTRAEFHRIAVRHVIDTLMSGEVDAMLAAFVDVTESVDPEQLERLDSLIATRLRERE